jgi:cytochrome c oxidase assembly protein subunit 15
MNRAEIARFRKLALTTVLFVYFLILVGGAVRASGAGMGCPDWPTCFGRWIPPTSEQQLPANYQQIYADRGYAQTRFNPTKTWIEYLNRLLGVTIGLLILATMVAARRYWNHDRTVSLVAVGAFAAVAFQGWLGSRVVASNLQPGMITLHMLMAQFIVALLIYGLVRSQRAVASPDGLDSLSPRFRVVLIVAMAMILLQMVMGTQVREAIDIIARALEADTRNQWIERLPPIFLVHRSFSSIILFTNLWLVWQLWKHLAPGQLLRKMGVLLAVILVATILMGVVMDRLHVPAVAQPLHLWFASIIFGIQFSIYLLYQFGRQQNTSTLLPQSELQVSTTNA